MNQIIDYVLANLATLTTIQQGLFAALALICQLAGAPAASKVFGTFTTVDLGRIARYVKSILEARKIVNGIGTGAFLLVASLGLVEQGCSRTTVDAQIDKALLIEDQVLVQVDYLTTVFDSLVANPVLPADKQAEYRQKFVEAKQVLVAAVDAKDTALRAAKEANAATVDINALVNGIVDAVQKIISIVAMVGASPLFVQEQQVKALSLTRGL